MDHDTVNRLIEENLQNIFGFAMSRLHDRAEAEALTSDIVYAVLRSSGQLTDDHKFYGWMWQIARICYVNRLRAAQRMPTELDEAIPDEGRSPEDEVILHDDLARMRRELALLSAKQRQATVLYYMDNLSCAKVASQLSISVEMVKYLLFRARNFIREGMNMERIYGEKSYNPKQFEIDFWGTKGGDDCEYRLFRDRKIRGNILIAAYYTPMSLPELSLELGVATPYLEDEIRLLLARKYLVERRDKYVANIPIFTEECTDEIRRQTVKLADAAAEQLTNISFADFAAAYGDRFVDENLLHWQILTLSAHFALLRSGDEGNTPLPETDAYSLVNGGGGRGFVWGRSCGGGNMIAHYFEGIYNGTPSGDGRGSVIAFNFAQTLGTQHVYGRLIDPLVATACGCAEFLPTESRDHLTTQGYLIGGSPNYPVYANADYNRFPTLLQESTTLTDTLCREARTLATKIIADHAPTHIRSIASQVGKLAFQFDCLAQLSDALAARGWLSPVENRLTPKPAMCVILNQ